MSKFDADDPQANDQTVCNEEAETGVPSSDPQLYQDVSCILRFFFSIANRNSIESFPVNPRNENVKRTKNE